MAKVSVKERQEYLQAGEKAFKQIVADCWLWDDVDDMQSRLGGAFVMMLEFLPEIDDFSELIDEARSLCDRYCRQAKTAVACLAELGVRKKAA